MSSIKAAVQEPTNSTTSRATGFPEPLSPDRNTTLPHPTADRSPNATILAPDIAPRPGHSRSRSFLSRKNSHRSKHKAGKSVEIENGTVTVLPIPNNGEKGLYDGIVYADGSREDVGNESRGSEGNKSIDGSEGETARVSEDEDRDETGYGPGERKKGVLRKLKLHKV